jgi:O-antigen/teichoic acid export membrane protein
VPSTFRNSYLRGKQNFGLVSWVGVITAGGDLILSAVLVVMGAGTIGAIIGLVLAQALAFAFAAIAARRHGFIEHVRRRLIRLPNLRRIFPELKYATYVLIASLGITLFYSMDILIVKHYFDARIAGLYAGIATVSRIIFFSTDSISQVLVPAVKITASASDNQQVLLKSFMLLFSVGGLIWLVFALLPQLIVRVLMGSKYLPYASLLPRLSLVLLLVSVANLVVTYHMALRRIMVAFIVIIGLGATLLIVSHHHDSLVAVVNSLLFGTLTLLILLSGWMTVSKVKDNLQA